MRLWIWGLPLSRVVGHFHHILLLHICQSSPTSHPILCPGSWPHFFFCLSVVGLLSASYTVSSPQQNELQFYQNYNVRTHWNLVACGKEGRTTLLNVLCCRMPDLQTGTGATYALIFPAQVCRAESSWGSVCFLNKPGFSSCWAWFSESLLQNNRAGRGWMGCFGVWIA